MHPRVGTILGDYELSASLGSGSFGQVFLAKHRERDTTCAIKVFNPGRCSATTLRYTAQLTAAAVATPGVHACPIHDAVIDGPEPYFVLELVGGESLESLRRRSSRLTWAQARPIFARVAAILDAAHRAGIIHGNLKPANIRVISRAGGPPTVCLLDWGLGRAHDSHDDGATRIDQGLAVDYQAPEQLGGAPPGPATDLYALGIVLYEAVTGQRPFLGAANVVAMHHMRTPPPSPLSSAPDLPPGAAALISRLLDKIPAHRPSASELHGLLRDSTVMPVPAPSASPDDHEPATEIFRRPLHVYADRVSAETTIVTTQHTQRSVPRSAETIVVRAPQAPEHQQQGAVTLILESTQGQLLLDTDPKLAVINHAQEHTSVTLNPSATVFVKHLSAATLHAPLSSLPRPARTQQLRTWLRGPWTLERKLITFNVLLVCVIVFGVVAAFST